MTTNKQIAQTILQQYGGNALRIFTGAKNFVALPEDDNHLGGLQFKIPRTNGITHVETKLNGLDTYDVKFIRVHGTKRTVVKEYNGLYFDGLIPTFEDETKLYVRM